MKIDNLFIKLLTYIILLAIAVIFILPLYWIIITSFKFEGDIFLIPPQFLPNPVSWSNYPELLGRQNYLLYSLNSLKIASIGTFGVLLSCSMAAFAFARLKFPGSKIIFAILISTMMIPIQVTLIPQFLIFNAIGLVGTHWALIVPDFLARAIGVFLIRQFFLTVPKELEEAARIDGCSNFGIYTRIFLPIAKPTLAALAIFSFMDQWNDLLRPVIYLTEASQRTLTMALAMFIDPYIAKWTLFMSGAILSMLPLLLIYIFAQRYFVKGMVTSGLKI